MLADCSSSISSFCWKNNQYVTHCPLCPRDSYCNVTKTGSVFSYGCVKSNFCATLCTGTKWCHSFYNYTLTTGNRNVFKTCRHYPQYTIENPHNECVNCNLCTPSCGAEEQCVGSICVPNIYNICSFQFNNKVPLICTTGQICVKSVCVSVTAPPNPFTFPAWSVPANTFASTTIMINFIRYSLTHCSFCNQNQMCQLTVTKTDGISAKSYECVAVLASQICKGTFYPKSYLSDGDFVSKVIGCDKSPQFTTHADNEVLACSPVCDTNYYNCVGTTCIPKIVGVCSYQNQHPVYCKPDEACVNMQCRQAIHLGVRYYNSCGAVKDQSICINDVTVPLITCPICKNNEICVGINVHTTYYIYRCVANAACNCPTYQYCHSSYSKSTNVTTVIGCLTYPQFDNVLPNVACNPACPTTQICFQEICMPKLERLCGWVFENTVPIICQEQELCFNGICYNPLKYSDVLEALYPALTCKVGTLCTKTQTLTLSQCPLCKQTQYCKMTYDSGTSKYSYACVEDLVNCNCKGTNYCWADYNFMPDSSVTAVLSHPVKCLPYPQFEMKWNSVVPTYVNCNPACTASQFCLAGICYNLLTNVCYYASTNEPVSCDSAYEICKNAMCVRFFSIGLTRIDDRLCTAGQIYRNGACFTPPACPICPRNSYCKGSNNNGVITYSCVNHISCNNCATNQFCLGDFDYSIDGTVGTDPNLCSSSMPLGYECKGNDCPTSTKCTPECANPKVCINQICQDPIPNFCGLEFLYTVPFSCDSSQFCFDSKCWARDMSFGCLDQPLMSICNKMFVPPLDDIVLKECPPCKQNEFCYAEIVDTKYKYRCATSPKCVCTGSQSCQGEFDFEVNGKVSTTTMCVNILQFTFPYVTGNSVTDDYVTTCQSFADGSKCTNPPAEADKTICSGGICVPILKDVCYYSGKGNIPVICKKTEICKKNRCVDNYKNLLLADRILTFSYLGKTYDLTNTGQCPICAQNEYCKGSRIGLIYQFVCTIDERCDACTGTQFCQGSFDWITGIGSVSDTPCGDEPQLGYPLTDCSPFKCPTTCATTEYCQGVIAGTGFTLACTPEDTETKRCTTCNSGPIVIPPVDPGTGDRRLQDPDPYVVQFCYGIFDFSSTGTLDLTKCYDTAQLTYGVDCSKAEAVCITIDLN